MLESNLKAKQIEKRRAGFFSLKNSGRNIYKTIFSQFKKKKFVFSEDIELEKYTEQILTIAVFLFTTSPFLCKRKTENLLNFHWIEYFRVFSKKDVSHFVDCSVLYLLENSKVLKKEEEKNGKCLFRTKASFKEAYALSIFNKSYGGNLSLMEIRFDKYLNLIAISLRLFEIIRYEISKNFSKVLELVRISHVWKEKMYEIFGFKAEYIAFLYFLNLRKNRETKIDKLLVKYLF